MADSATFWDLAGPAAELIIAFGGGLAGVVGGVVSILTARQARRDEDRRLKEGQAHDERLKTLEATIERDRFQAAHLHEARARVIAELYQRLVTAERHVLWLESDVGEGVREECREQLRTLRHYADEHAIYFPPDTWKRVQECIGGLSVLFQIDRMQINARTDDTFEKAEAKAAEVRSDLELARQELETQWRAMLGVESAQKASSSGSR